MTYNSYAQFSKKAASLPKLALLLLYLTEDLNLLGLFDCNVGLTTKCPVVNVSEIVKEDQPLSHTRVDMTPTKNKTLTECVTKNSRRLICLTNHLRILHRAVSKVFSGCLSSTPIPLLFIETQLPLFKVTSKHQAFLSF